MRPDKRLPGKAINKLNLFSIKGGNPRAILAIGFWMSRKSPPSEASLNDKTTFCLPIPCDSRNLSEYLNHF